jgi:hypothetical protein
VATTEAKERHESEHAWNVQVHGPVLKCTFRATAGLPHLRDKVMCALPIRALHEHMLKITEPLPA